MNTFDLREREALRQDILAAIAAGRDVAPEMDGQLADSVLDRYLHEATGRGYLLFATGLLPLVMRTFTRLAVLGAVVLIVGMLLLTIAISTLGPHLNFPLPWLND